MCGIELAININYYYSDVDVVQMAFRLLDSDIADSEVRRLAVEKLKIIPIPDMKYYMLQLVQVC